jgi:hypothetical protein
MNKRRVTIIAAAIVLVLLFCSPLYRWWTEPMYQGQRVSYWFRRFREAPAGAQPNTLTTWTFSPDGRRVYRNWEPVADPGKEALLKIGEPAIRFLERRIAGGGFGVRSVYGRAYTNLPLVLRNTLPNPYQRDRERTDAIVALASFGTKAHRSVPRIIDHLPDLSLGSLGIAIQVLPNLDPERAEIDRLVETFAASRRYEEMKLVVDRCGVRSPGAARAVTTMLEEQGGSGADCLERSNGLVPEFVIG